jgi:hypothetical protein
MIVFLYTGPPSPGGPGDKRLLFEETLKEDSAVAILDVTTENI